ncbi:MAG: D-TA family PLP-dependent enzyme [Verrucomicrobiia bacterium]
MESQSCDLDWFKVRDAAAIPSPGLLVYYERVQENLRRMLAIAGTPERLRPHIKTHKIREVLDMQLALGISKFKCATLAEAEMAARAGVPDLLLAYPPVGPSVAGLVSLRRAFPKTRLSVICDNPGALRALSRSISGDDARVTRAEEALEVLVDLDIGQHRTGLPPGPEAAELYALITSLPGLKAGGLHAYDGHIAHTDPAARAAACDEAFASVLALQNSLMKAGLPVPRVVAGGTPTFPIHARRADVECSPGTCVFWDAGYASKLPDLDFLPAAVLLTRVISKPGSNRLCLDLGHKAVASEMPQPRVRFLNLEDAKPVVHSEEHLVVETARSDEFVVGQCLYGIPWHICPTVALHSHVAVVKNGALSGYWVVAARGRRLTLGE